MEPIAVGVVVVLVVVAVAAVAVVVVGAFGSNDESSFEGLLAES